MVRTEKQRVLDKAISKKEKIMHCIKFRGKRIDNGEWVYGYLDWDREFIDSENILFFIHTGYDGGFEESYEVDPATVGQYTGLKDKKRTKEYPEGQEIYGEGDIYKDAFGVISIVKMAVDGWALFPIHKGTPVRNLYWHNVCNKTKGEVIGTVHDNPELL